MPKQPAFPRLRDAMAEETLYDSKAMRRFAGTELGDDQIPDETTILNFRHLKEMHGLTQAILEGVDANTVLGHAWSMRRSSTHRLRRRT